MPHAAPLARWTKRLAGALALLAVSAAPATQPAHPFRDTVKVDVSDDYLVVHSNGIPDHTTGPFPNRNNPNTIRAQNYTFKIPRHPAKADKITKLPMGPIG